MTTTDPAARLREAAETLRQHLAAIATDSPADLPLHADGRTVTQGRVGLHDFAVAETPEVAGYIVAMGPLVGEALAAWLESAADGSDNAMHDVAEYPDDDPDEGPQCVDDCDACTDEAAALAVADALLDPETPRTSV